MAAPPQASSALVNVSEQAELRLVQLLADSCPSPAAVEMTFAPECEGYIGNGDAAGLVRTVLGDAGAISGLLAIEPKDEAAGAFSLIAALLERVEGAAEQSALSVALADAVTNGAADDAAAGKRAAMLAALYNLSSNGTEKANLLARIVSLTAASDPGALSPGRPLGDVLDAANVRSMVEGWGVGRADQRRLYRAIADGLAAGARRQTFLLSLLATYASASEVDTEAIATATDAAVGAVRDPVGLFDEQRGMLLLPPVAALGSSPATKSLFELLQVFQEGKLEDFEAFAKGSESTLSSHGLSKDDCIRNMRLLSLCSLAAEHEEIPYSAIAATLHVDDSEVEGWVIAAVSSGLLSAKMDQLQKVVMVERCVVRKFGTEQWKALQARLDAWKGNVRSVLNGLDKSQALQKPAA